MIKYETREQWLTAAVDMLRPEFVIKAGVMVPDVRVSVGFPGGAHPVQTIGQCWKPVATEDGVSQIYINPIIGEATRALDVLIHELVHAVWPDAGHGKAFRDVAVAMGLTGKMTATTAGEELQDRLTQMVEELGDYPHSAIKLVEHITPTGRKKARIEGAPEPKTRMLKVQCVGCGMSYRTSNLWLTQLQEKYGEGYAGECVLCGDTMEVK